MNYNYTLTFYQDSHNEWRWRIKSHNGEIIASSSEGYVNKEACENNIETLLSLESIHGT